MSFTESAYRLDPGGDIRAVGRATTEGPAGTTTHFLYVHIFWQPKPGKTHADSTTTDAILRYFVSTERGTATYVGTGFAYPKKTFGTGLEIQIESGRLHLDATTGEVIDILGDTRLSGMLAARRDPAIATNLIRDAELLAAH